MSKKYRKLLKRLSEYPVSKIIEQYITVSHKNGKSSAKSPFHDDSYIQIVDEKGVWFCPKENIGGDAISFVKNYLDVGFLEALQDINERLEEITKKYTPSRLDKFSSELTNIESPLREHLRDLEYLPKFKYGLETGYEKLDEILQGLKSGSLTILAGRPAMGKTALALNIIVKSIQLTEKPIAIYSLEMVAKELSSRILCTKARVESRNVINKKFKDKDLRNIARAVHEISEYPIMINDSGATTVKKIRKDCLKLKRDSGVGLIVVDYIQLINPSNKNESREEQVSGIINDLKKVALDVDCPVLALSQLSRSVDSREDKRPKMSDLEEGGLYLHNVDTVMFIYRDEYYNPDSEEEGLAEILIPRNRNGTTGMALLEFESRFCEFKDYGNE